MNHKYSFSLGGHSVTKDIGRHSERDPILFGFVPSWYEIRAFSTCEGWK